MSAQSDYPNVWTKSRPARLHALAAESAALALADLARQGAPLPEAFAYGWRCHILGFVDAVANSAHLFPTEYLGAFLDGASQAAVSLD